MSSLRRITVTGIGLTGVVLALTACGGDGQQGIPTETPSPPAITQEDATTASTTTAATTTVAPPPPGPAVGDVPGNQPAASALRAFLTDLDAGGVPAVAEKCWTVPPSEIPARYGDVAMILDAAAQPGFDGQDAVTWSSPAITLLVTRSEVAGGYACPAVLPGGPSIAGAYTDIDAEYTVERYLGRLTGNPQNPADLEGDYPLICDNRTAWDPQGTGSPTIPPLVDNPGRLTDSASYKPDSVYVAAREGEYTTVYADVTDVSGFEQNQIFTLTIDASGYCIGEVA